MCDCKEEVEVYAGDTFGFAARFYRLGSNDPVLKADITSINVRTFEGSGTTRLLVDTKVRDKADVWFDTYQTNQQWVICTDSTGYNFADKTKLPKMNMRYQVEAVVVLANGDQYTERWSFRTI